MCISLKKLQSYENFLISVFSPNVKENLTYKNINIITISGRLDNGASSHS